MSDPSRETKSFQGRTPTPIESRVYGLLVAIATLLGGFVAILTIVDFVNNQKIKDLVIAAGILLVLLPLLYVGYFVYSGKDRRLGFVVVSLIVMAATGGFSSAYGIKGQKAERSKSDGSQGEVDPTVTPVKSDQTQSPSTAPPSTAAVKIDSPREGEWVSGRFSVSGTASGLGNDSLWLFDYSGTSAGPGLVYYRTADSAISVKGDNWVTADGPIGNSSDIGLSFTIILVRANPQCSSLISATKANAEGDVVIGSNLPAGCREVAELHVKKKA